MAETKKNAFLYVGHSNWGKSYALKVLTDNKSRKQQVWLNNRCFKVRKMSNDDKEEDLLRFVHKIPYGHYNDFIIAYCPNHINRPQAKEILKELKAKFDLYFFVQKKQYSNPSNEITDDKIKSLREYGVVHVLSTKEEDTERAQRFREFILANC